MAGLVARVSRSDEHPDDHGDVLGHVTIDRVARAAGVSRRHLYNLWGSQPEFQADLLSFLSRRESADHFADFDEAALESIVDLHDPIELALTIGELVNEKRPATDGQTQRARFAFRGQLTDPGIRGRVEANLERAIEQQTTRLNKLAEVVGLDPQALDGEHISLLGTVALTPCSTQRKVDR